MNAMIASLITVFTLTASASFAISQQNQIALNHVNHRLALAASLHGQTPTDEPCQVLTSEDALSIFKSEDSGTSVDFADYDMDIKKKSDQLQLFAPTCDGHSEVSIQEFSADRKMVVTLTNEFRGFETQEVCILKTAK